MDGYHDWFGVAGGGGYCRVLIAFSQEHIVTYGIRIRRLVGHKSNATYQGKVSKEEGEYIVNGGIIASYINSSPEHPI